jgi:hypothetical protein
VTYTLALKYPTGREVANGRIMFSTTEDEVFFLDLSDAAKIHALGLAPNEPFEIRKAVTGSGRNKETGFLFRRKQERPEIAAPAAPAPLPANAMGLARAGSAKKQRRNGGLGTPT